MAWKILNDFVVCTVAAGGQAVHRAPIQYKHVVLPV